MRSSRATRTRMRTRKRRTRKRRTRKRRMRTSTRTMSSRRTRRTRRTVRRITSRSRSRLEPPFSTWSRSRPNLVGSGVGSGTSDFRSRKQAK